MLLKRQGFPEEGEFVLCTVSSVQHNSVFVNLDEYSKSALIHISEIAPGRIRNIRDYVVEGKKVVCLVLRIDQEKGHIDLSLRRVNDNQKRAKLNAIKQEQKAEKIVEYVAHKLNVGLTLFYKEIFTQVSRKYSSLYPFFEDIALGKLKIAELGLDKEKAKVLEEAITTRIKPAEVEMNSEVEIKSYAKDGVTIIKEVLKNVLVKFPALVIKYEGGGKYKIFVKAGDYKEAEKILSSCFELISELIKKKSGEAKLIPKPKK